MIDNAANAKPNIAKYLPIFDVSYTQHDPLAPQLLPHIPHVESITAPYIRGPGILPEVYKTFCRKVMKTAIELKLKRLHYNDAP